MKNMGMRELALVGPAPRRSERERAMAVHAADIVEAASVVGSLPEAVADCGFVVGTTCRAGLYRSSRVPIEELAPEVIERACRGRVALVFGPEDHGLSNRDLKTCQRLAAIETGSDYRSLNLAQAVLLACYELRRAAAGARKDSARSRPVPAPAGRVEFLMQRLERAFLQIGFLNPQNPDHIMLAIRRLFGRASLEAHDVNILLGLARQIEWYANGGWRKRGGGATLSARGPEDGQA